MLIIAGILIALPNRHAAQAAGARIRIVPPAGVYSPGTAIQVSGFSFASNENISIYWNYTGPGTGTLVATAITDTTGTFSASFKKVLAPTGPYTIAAIGQTSGSVATGAFQLLPELHVNPPAGSSSNRLYITGHAFGAGETVNLYWNYTGPNTGILLTTTTSDATGSFKTNAAIPGSTTAGYIPIVGVGQTSNATGKFMFLLYPPTLTLAPLAGSASTTLTLSAYGFKAAEQVNIFWDNQTTPVVTVTTVADGYLSPTAITVPAGAPPGNYVIKAVGVKSHTTATNMFSVVTPSSTLSLASGPVGANVNITGQGFAPNETVNILWNYSGPATGSSLAQLQAGASGIISGNFAIPVSSNGTYTIAAEGAISNAVTQSSFTLQNGLSVSPVTLSPGSSMIATGSGFQSNEPAKLYLDSTSGSLLGTATADAFGNVSQNISIPATTTPGVHQIIALGQTSGSSFSTQVTIDTSWGQFGFDNTHHRQNNAEHKLGRDNVANLQVKWTATTNTALANLEDSPIYANGIVYMVMTDGSLKAYNATTGTLKWQYLPPVGFPMYSSPLVDPVANMVFFGTVPNFDPGAPSPFYALNASTGVLLWSVILPGDEYGFPSLAFQTIYVGSTHEGGPGTLEAIDEITGRIAWQQNINSGVWGSVAVDTGKNVVFTGVGNPANMIVAYNAHTGSTIWQFAVPNSGPDQDVGSGVTVSGGLVYANSKNGNIYALDENTGTLSWTTPVGTPTGEDVSTQAIALNGVLYVGSGDKNLYAINASTGAILWKTATGGTIDSSAAIANGVVYIASFDKSIYAIDANSGAVLWHYATGGIVFSSPIVVNGWLYFGSTDGKLYAFSL